MSRGIILYGASGSGKTTLGKELAERLGFSHIDIDSHIWRWDTKIPFTIHMNVISIFHIAIPHNGVALPMPQTFGQMVFQRPVGAFGPAKPQAAVRDDDPAFFDVFAG